jgi:hypothetical protein
MFIFTQRVKGVSIWINGENYAHVFNEDTCILGIMGIRIGKIKEGFVVYHSQRYEIFSWNKIDRILWDV